MKADYVPKLLPIPCLGVITDRTLLPAGETLAQALSPSVTGGVAIVILQETDLPKTPRKTVAEFVTDGIRGRAIFMIAENAELAIQVGADGVHLHGGVGEILKARGIIGDLGLIGFTAKSLEEASLAGKNGADYLLVCVDWSDPLSAVSILKQYVSATKLPVLAGADVPKEQVRLCIASGASSVCVIAKAMNSADRAEEMRNYCKELAID